MPWRPACRTRSRSLLVLTALAACGDGAVEVAGPPGTLGVTLSVATLDVTQGERGSVAVAVVRGGGFAGPVTLDLEGEPSGVVGSFEPAAVPPGTSSSGLSIDVDGGVRPDAYGLTVRARGSGVPDATAALALRVMPARAVALSLSPDSLEIQGGASATTTLRLTRTNFAGAVGLEVRGAPDGLAVVPEASRVTDSTVTVTVVAARSLEPGTYTVTILGTGAGIPEVSAALVVTTTAAPAVALSVSPDSVVVEGGTSVTTTLRVARTNYTGAVEVAVSHAPDGLSVVAETTTVTDSATTLTVTADRDMGSGPYAVRITGTGTGIPEAAVLLHVRVTAAPAVALSLSPDSVRVQGGSSVSTTLHVSRTKFAEPVMLAVTGAPEGLAVVPASRSVTGSSTPVTVTADRALEPGTYTVTITATGAGIPDASATLVVATTAGPAVALSLSPDSLLVQGGSSATTALRVSRTSFTGPVELAVTGAPEGLAVVPAAGTVTDSATTLTVTADRAVEPGTHAVTITATGAGIPDASAALTVVVVQAPGVTLSLSADTVAVAGGSSTTTGLTLERTNFTAPVELTVNGAPAGLAVVPAARTVLDATTTLTVTADLGLSPGTYDVTVTGRGTGIPDATATLTVKTTAALASWLAEHPAVAEQLVWETSDGARAYHDWSPAERAQLDSVYRETLRGAVELREIPANLLADHLGNDDWPYTVLSPGSARALYLASVAHSLALELTGALPWSVLEYSAGELQTLFDGRSFYSWTEGALGTGVSGYLVAGWVLPATPAFGYGFMASGRLRSTPRGTLEGFVDWGRVAGVHFTGAYSAAGAEAHWDYRGVAPLSRILEGTNNPLHPFNLFASWFPGCHGVNHALISLFRNVNIPVDYVVAAGHATPWFPTERIYLNHGDDIYTGYGRITGLDEQRRPEHIIPAAEFPIDEATWLAWLGPGVDEETRVANISRRMVDLAFEYLPHKVLDNRCRDLASGASREESLVYTYGGAHRIYTVEELEATGLWERLDAEIELLGGCGEVPRT